ncbi:MAG: Gldg family protein [Lachnospiraceae bacterium]|nr:Gldg family protein [Lachnospiraceae bacterium]
MKLLKGKNGASEAVPKEPKEKQPVNKKALVNGSFAMAMTAIAIAVIVVINFIVGAIPTKFTQFDVTDQKLYTIGSTTKKILDNLNDDVTLNFLTSGTPDEMISKLLDTYEGYSKHVKVKKVDLVSNPTFAQKYTSDNVTANSIIAVCGDRSKVVDYNNMYEMDYSSYSYSASGFDGEGQITSAISYVTSSNASRLYYTTGHNELSLSSGMTDAFSKANVDTAELNLLTSDVPDDCSVLMIFSPLQDFTEAEADKVITYLQNGGKAMIVSMSPAVNNNTKTPNFDKILSAYGITRKGGLVLEGDTNAYVQAPYLMVPTIDTSSDVTSSLSNQNIVYALGEALSLDDSEDATYTQTTLLSTSDQAYIKSDLSNASTMEKEDGDETGSFPLAVQVEETLSNGSDGTSDVADSSASSTDSSAESSASSTSAEEAADSSATTADSSTDADSSDAKTTKLLYFTTPAVFDADALSQMIQTSTSLPEGNNELLANSITYLTDQEVTVSVASKSMSTPQTTIDSGKVQLLGNLAMFALPVAVIIAGVVIFVRRRRK